MFELQIANQSLSLGVPKGPFSFAKENGPFDSLPCTVQGKLLPHWCGNRCKLFCEEIFDRPARSGHAALHKIRLAAAAAVQLGIHLFRELTKIAADMPDGVLVRAVRAGKDRAAAAAVVRDRVAAMRRSSSSRKTACCRRSRPSADSARLQRSTPSRSARGRTLHRWRSFPSAATSCRRRISTSCARWARLRDCLKRAS